MPNKGLYQSFLILEFVALAVLIGSLFWLGQIMQAGASLSMFHRLLPTIASGLVLTGFVGCMYVRWLAAADQAKPTRRFPFVLFWCFAFTLFLIWLYAASQWMISDLTVPAQL